MWGPAPEPRRPPRAPANPAGSQRRGLGAPGCAPVPAPVWPAIRLLVLRPAGCPSRVWLCLRSCLNLRPQLLSPAPRLSSDVPALAPTLSDPSLDLAASPVRSCPGSNSAPTPATPASLPEPNPELSPRLACLGPPLRAGFGAGPAPSTSLGSVSDLTHIQATLPKTQPRLQFRRNLDPGVALMSAILLLGSQASAPVPAVSWFQPVPGLGRLWAARTGRGS